MSSVTCKFHLTFRREQGRFTSVKLFNSPFRADSFRQHLRLVHPTRWKQFETQKSDVKRQLFFDFEVPYAENIESHMGSSDPGLFLKVSSAVIELLKTLYIEESSSENLPPFVTLVNGYHHLVSIRRKKVFRVLIEQVSHDLSFREVKLTLQNLRQNCGLSFLDLVTEKRVSQFIQPLCLLSLCHLHRREIPAVFVRFSGSATLSGVL